nr:hypothetical protein [Mycolicibacterium helvum]
MAAALSFVLGGVVSVTGFAWADEGSDYDPVAQYDQPQRLPVITVHPSEWQPQFPFPFDQTQRYVTPVDIEAEREMCQWYDAQFDTIKHQVEGLNDNVIRHNGDFGADGVWQQAGIVIANLDQSLDFLTPRAQALTQSYDHAGDLYFPIYQGDAFYGLWQQMSNVSNGLKARQPTWFSGPSYLRMLHWGSKIHRSDVCG